MRRQERLAARHQATRRQQVVLPQSQVGLALTRRPTHLLERVGAHAEQDGGATGRLVVRLLVRIDVGEQLLEARVHERPRFGARLRASRVHVLVGEQHRQALVPRIERERFGRHEVVRCCHIVHVAAARQWWWSHGRLVLAACQLGTAIGLPTLI